MSGHDSRTKTPAEMPEDAGEGGAVSLQDNNVYEAHKGLRDVIGRKPGGNVKLFAKFQEKEAVSRRSLVEDSLSKINEANQSLEEGHIDKGGEIIEGLIISLRGQIDECDNKQAGLKLGSGNLSSAEIATGFEILATLGCKGMLESILAAVEKVAQEVKRNHSGDQIMIGDLVDELEEQLNRHEQAIQAARDAYER